MRMPTETALERVRVLIERADAAPRLHTLAQAVQLSPAHLQRAFRRRYGMSPAEYHRARRFGQLKVALRDGAAVTTAVYEAGSPGGWRWGVERKRQLLDREQRQAADEPARNRLG